MLSHGIPTPVAAKALALIPAAKALLLIPAAKAFQRQKIQDYYYYHEFFMRLDIASMHLKIGDMN